MHARVRSRAAGARRRVRSTPSPSRVMVARSKRGTRPFGPASAIRSSTELVPISSVATRTTAGDGAGRLLRQALEVEHLFHVGLDDQLDAAVLLATLVRLVRRNRIGVGVAGGAPVRRRENAALLVLGRREQHGDGARAHRGEAPVVAEGTAGE